ncbi:MULTISPECIES: hypothetical protein [Priestia]|mgnify:CR=1 FL=1|jgi:hypothetical protein|uniref:Uncharacterized protein n=5 Tax=Priestia TaxID=2800373 RepID=A0A0B6AMH3_PRIM2|nr:MULTISPECIES: hypothetical protein [Priestia]MCJ7989024.1 hypothetical protein [Priestia sp. OVS21]RCX25344.1 hypothetical protein DEU47_103362 [Bacillus sp. AG236]TCN10777.1 hypothetical protein EV581_104167 [Bacillus sp. BK006]AJI21808.1 hypothetical protein BG04_4856 [Priestia megaterium NBRC 15308 = ATCC 14581]KFM96914.1 hypothetical protein DJ91_412 [Priestia megaterium]
MMEQTKMTFEPASINDDMHAKLKQLEEQFQQTLGKRVALVAYEAEK